MDCGLGIADCGLSNTFNPKSEIRNPQFLGFTLIELTLVVVTIGIVLMAAVPRLQQTAQRLRAEQVSTELAHLLRVAHEQAVSSGEEAVWTWDASAHRARVQSAAAQPESGEAAPASAMHQTSPAPEGVAVTVTRTEEPLDCGCVHFFPDGTSENATLTVRLSQHAFTVTVDEATSQVLLSIGTAPR